LKPSDFREWKAYLEWLEKPDLVGGLVQGERVVDARKAVEIAREYAKTSMGTLYWRDVIECEFIEKTGDWRVVFEASPGLLAPYYTYEVVIESSTGHVKRAKRIEE
jgi:hypothetical protein